MAFEKGESGNPNGRPKGSKNRSTKAMKKVLAQLIDDNLDNMSVWLNEIAKDDPRVAFQCMLNMMKFNIPKISRTSAVVEKEEEVQTKNYSESILKISEKLIDEAIKNQKNNELEVF